MVILRCWIRQAYASLFPPIKIISAYSPVSSFVAHYVVGRIDSRMAIYASDRPCSSAPLISNRL